MSFRIVVDNMIKIYDAPQEIVQWCNNNLILENPDYFKKKRMGYWAGNTPKNICLFDIIKDKKEGEKEKTNLLLPFGLIDYFKNFKEYITYRNLPHNRVGYACGIKLRPYQQNALERLFKAEYGILQSPAGSGKTQIGLALISKYNTKALWITHTKDLLNQSKKRAEQYIDKSLLGTITEGKVNIGSAITFATVQTLTNIDLDEYKNEWDVIVVDECHRASTNAKTVTMFQKVLNSLSSKHKYGISATMHRSDGLIFTTEALLGGIKYDVSKKDIEQYLMPVSILPIFTEVSFNEQMSNGDGTLNYNNTITYLCENEQRNKIIVNDIIANSNKYCLVLSTRLKHLETLFNMLPPFIAEKSVFINGKMVGKKRKAEREKALEDMRNGKKHVLFATYSLVKEGLDIPRLNRLFLTIPQKDFVVVTQSVGRIERKCENKENSLVYDYIDNTSFLYKSFKKRKSIYNKNGYTIL